MEIIGLSAHSASKMYSLKGLRLLSSRSLTAYRVGHKMSRLSLSKCRNPIFILDEFLTTPFARWVARASAFSLNWPPLK